VAIFLIGRYDAIGFNRSAMRANSLSAASFIDAASHCSPKAKSGDTGYEEKGVDGRFLAQVK
jgi:hypothetical protein